MNCLTNSAENKIKEAAIKVFLEKGFDGTTTRDIAKEAGVNSALMNYYFRSKEKLFSSVFEEKLQQYFSGMIEIFNKPIGMKEKISDLIENDFQMFKKNPDLSNFIIHELHRNPDRFFSAVAFDKIVDHSSLSKQLTTSIENGEVIQIDIKNVLLLMKSNIQFIFLCKSMTCKMWKMEDESFEEFAEKHKTIVKEMILNYLFNSSKN